MFKTKRNFLFSLIVLWVGFAAPSSAAAQVRLSMEWDAVSALDLAGYIVLWGNSSGVYEYSQNVGLETSFTLDSAERGQTYYFVVTAYDEAGNESSYSNEISRAIAAASPDDVDEDGTPNNLDDDDDNDGLTDAEEATLGTDPLVVDSDNDGVSDGEEVSDGTDPLDAGSFQPELGTTLCALWNSFLSMWNVFEHLNLSDQSRRVFLRLYNIDGDEVDTLVFDVGAGRQVDILLHDLISENSLQNSYGRVCSSYTGTAGSLRSTMVYYKPNDSQSQSGQFQYAIALPVTDGLAGPQYVPFNTFQPSLWPGDAGNLVANWIAITNRSSSSQSGTLRFYDTAGTELGSVTITLASGERRDVSGHQFGESLVGFAEWSPNNAQARFELKNLRYLYDNATGENSFDTAFQVEGRRGSGSLLAAPLDSNGRSAILELSNTSSSDTTATVRIYDSTGSLLETLNRTLSPKSSEHIITDTILNGERGMALIQASELGSLLAVAMQYDRTTTAGINYMYGIPGAEALGTVLRTSYNTFLEQSSELWLANPYDTDMTLTLKLVRYDGTTVADNQSVSVPAHGLTVVTLNDFESADNYGVVSITPSGNTPVAWVKRRRAGEFVIPTLGQE